MIKAAVSDFSKVILFPEDPTYIGSLNALHKELSATANYNPLDHFEMNTELLELYRMLAFKVPFYIFTSDAIQDAPEFQPFLQPIFTEVLSARKLNIDKKTSAAYSAIASHLKLQPEEVLYIDDAPENIEAATQAGLKTILYQDLDSLRPQLLAALA